MRRAAMVALVAAVGLIAVLALRRAPVPATPAAPVEPDKRDEPSPLVDEPVRDPSSAPATRPSAPPPVESTEVLLRCMVEDAQSHLPKSGLQFWIAANASGKLEASGEARSGDDGTFEFRAPGNRVNQFVVSIKSSGFRLRSGSTIAVPPGMAGVQATLVVAAQDLVRIVVKGQNGVPVPFARVDWWREGRRAERSGGVTQVDGAFELPVDFGGSTFSAVAPGYGRGLLRVSVPVDMELELKPVTAVQGLLLDADGMPLANARLDVMLFRSEQIDQAPRQLTEEVATTELDGTFVLKSITPNWEYWVRVTSPSATSLGLEKPFFRGHADTRLVLRQRKP